MIKLVIASTNIHKIREFRSMLKHLPHLDLLSLCDFPSYRSLEETGKTFEENAISKAVDAAQKLNLLALADDSGLVVPSLNGAPGVYSARYAGNDASDFDNRKKLLQEMQSLESDRRNCYFSCAIALASPEGLLKVVQGSCEGMIATQEKGGSGFGYDPLFIKHGYSKTFAELEESIKNRISHRRKALDKMILFLESLISSEKEKE